MSRYIDADNTRAYISRLLGGLPLALLNECEKNGIDIIRCKECKRWWGNHYHDNEDGKCPMDAWIDGDGFCSYGEREGE